MFGLTTIAQINQAQLIEDRKRQAQQQPAKPNPYAATIGKGDQSFAGTLQIARNERP